MSTRRILVLGGTGFVGRQVCEQLARLGWQVTVPTRRAVNAAAIQNLPGLTVVEASVQRWDAVFADLAGPATPQGLLAADGPVRQRLYDAARALGRATTSLWPRSGGEQRLALEASGPMQLLPEGGGLVVPELEGLSLRNLPGRPPRRQLLPGSRDLSSFCPRGGRALLVRHWPDYRRSLELVEPGQSLEHGQIFDANSWMLTAAARETGAIAYRVPFVPDDPHRFTQVVEDQLVRADLVITSGGVSSCGDDSVFDGGVHGSLTFHFQRRLAC